MENTNKMKNLANDLKAFEQMMKEQRKERLKLAETTFSLANRGLAERGPYY